VQLARRAPGADAPAEVRVARQRQPGHQCVVTAAVSPSVGESSRGRSNEPLEQGRRGVLLDVGVREDLAATAVRALDALGALAVHAGRDPGPDAGAARAGLVPAAGRRALREVLRQVVVVADDALAQLEWLFLERLRYLRVCGRC
jgi:hypothetical protein